MLLLTQCPNCQTTFRVTSEILRVAEGQVRCGRCQTQFNALARLIDESQPGSESQTGGFQRPTPAENPTDEPSEQEDVTLGGRHVEIGGTYRAIETDDSGEHPLREEFTEEWIDVDDVEPGLDEGSALAGENLDELEFDESADDIRALADDVALPDNYVEDEYLGSDLANTDSAEPDVRRGRFDDDLVDEGLLADGLLDDMPTDHGLAQSEDSGASTLNDSNTEDAAPSTPVENVADVIARAAAAAAALRAQPQRAEPIAAPASPRVARVQAPRRAPALAPTEEEFDLLNPGSEAARAQPGAAKWKWLIAPLAVLLIAQVIHHYRSDIARHPKLGQPLMSLYGFLHLPLTPEWELRAYEIRQWGVLSDPSSPGTLKVRASITNRADFAQPYPLMKLVLEDRWGEQVRAREFEPDEYLDPDISPDRLLAPQQKTNATINIVDPGADAEGFRFDVCLRGRAGPVCAADIPE